MMRRLQALTLYAVLMLFLAFMYDFLLVHAAKARLIPGAGLGAARQLPEILYVPFVIFLAAFIVANRQKIVGVWPGALFPVALSAVNMVFVGCHPILTGPGACT